MATGEEKPVMVVGVDESEQSTYALEWTLDRFFAPYAPNFPFKLIIVHAKPNAVSAVGLAGPGNLFAFFLRVLFLWRDDFVVFLVWFRNCGGCALC